MLNIGDRVEHKSFGPGTVQNISGNKLFICFDNKSEISEFPLNRFNSFFRMIGTQHLASATKIAKKKPDSLGPSGAVISLFQAPESLDQLIDAYEKDGFTSIECFTDNTSSTINGFSVGKNSPIGGKVYFICGRSSLKYMEDNISELERNINDYSIEFIEFAKRQYQLYKQYAGKMLATGRVASIPEKDECKKNWYMADIENLELIVPPIDRDIVEENVSIAKGTGITYLKEIEYDYLEQLISNNH